MSRPKPKRGIKKIRLTASRLRANIYRVLDGILKTGIPVELERRGRKLRIVAVQRQHKLDRLIRRNLLKGNPEDVIHIDWHKEWRKP